MEKKKRVVIIGAGPAGLTAGFELLKQAPDQYEVIILEEDHRIGGISKTVNHGGNRMDLGGHRFFSKNDQIMEWWQQRMPLQGARSYDDKRLGRKSKLKKNGPDPEKEDVVMLSRNRVSRIYYHQKFFDYPVSLKWQTLKNMGLTTTLRAGGSYLTACLKPKKETSLENFYMNRFGRVLYSMFFEGYTEKLWGRHPREISADWGAQRVKGLSVRAVLSDIVLKKTKKYRNRFLEKTGKKTPYQNEKPAQTARETSLIEEFYYPKYGPGQMWELTAQAFCKMGGTLITGTKVTGLHQENGKIDRIFFSGKKSEKGEDSIESLEADIVISSMPLKDLIAGMNRVPENIRDIAAGLPYRDFVTIGLLVDGLQLKNETAVRTLGNIVPDCWIYVQDTGVRLGRIQIFNNWSPYLVKDPEHTVWIGLEYFCNEKEKFFHLPDQKLTDYAAGELVKMGILSDRGAVLDAHCERVKKAYPAYFDTYDRIAELTDYLDTIENLFCVGRNGQHRYNNMDHSMMTAFETVKHIVHGGKDRRHIWNVNVEGEYHESK